jgi:hypothetical protein
MNENNVTIRGIKPSTVALFFGTFGAILGLVVAILNMLYSTSAATNATDSLLQGLLFGLGVGALTLLLVPAVYFAVGWLIGYLQGIILNAVLRSSGGVELAVEREESMVTEPMTRQSTTDRPASMDGTRPSKTQPTFGEKIDRR